MAIDDTAGFVVTVRSLVGASLCESVLKYYTDAAAPAQASPSQFADEWESEIIPLWQDVLSTSVQIVDFTVDPTIPNGEGYTPYPPHTRGLSFVYGTVDSEALPPYVSGTIFKLPNILGQDPPTPEQEWRVGRVRVAGLPEDFQASGILNATAMTAMNTLANALPVIVADTLDHILYWRRLIGGDYFYMPAISCEAGSVLGSQNSRKIGY